jgi:hypothetical protein
VTGRWPGGFGCRRCRRTCGGGRWRPQIQPGQRVVHPEPAAYQLGDPGQRPALVLIPAPGGRAGVQHRLQLAQLRGAELAPGTTRALRDQRLPPAGVAGLLESGTLDQFNPVVRDFFEGAILLGRGRKLALSSQCRALSLGVAPSVGHRHWPRQVLPAELGAYQEHGQMLDISP